eukprot:CAMPEP_0175045384 /NCGR_PEP_ID=MMETSP0052_2-20121109/4385_1 /TAXON_ID=51329 ORGANISM="Polytomella parva, Strain SAG 63-3" /NCGR_SAMPLE_ID=MMETSP0052_2 /ASSEMBLY_ACC=CAM_ASM_000194 /LENGTH=167 /DNA_ID=CAMNT_0016308893 /DNA_START=150 /DNA_END=653 /DNA_ORIENTATION=+
MKLQCRSSLTFKVPINRSVKVCSSQSNKGDQKHVAKTIVIVSAGGNDGSGATSSGNPLTGGSGNHPLRFWAYFFAVFLFLGGAIGFYRRGSLASLLAGGLTAAVFFACSYFLRGSTALPAARVAFGVSLILGLAMGRRFFNSRKFFPAGIVASFSLSSAAWFAYCGL